MVGLDIALSSPTPLADDVLARAILDFSQDGVSRVVLQKTPASGPLAEPAFLEAVVRSADRVPVDSDGVIRRAAFVVPQAVGSSKPAFSCQADCAPDQDPRMAMAPARHEADAVWQTQGVHRCPG